MASVTLTSQRFPAGTTVDAYPKSAFGPTGPGNAAPGGSAAASAVVAAAASLAFTGLAAETDYYAYALVGPEHRYVAFNTRTTVFGALGDAVGGQRVQHRPDDVTTGSLAALNAAVTATVRDGMGACTIEVGGAFVATATFEVSFDGGTNYRVYPMLRSDSGFTVSSTSSTSGAWFAASLPAGATHVRARCSAYTSGTMTIRINQAVAPVEPVVAATLGLGSARIGSVQRAGYWYDDSIATLAALAVFTGVARDLTGALAGTLVQAGSPEEFRGLAISDVAGTLALEVSRDNTTWRRIQEVAGSTTGTGGLSVAQVRHYPTVRFARLVYVNGAVLQGHFTLQSMTL